MAGLLLFLKSLAAGSMCALAAWIAVLATYSWKQHTYVAQHGITGLGAVAGGWNLLLQSPIIAILLSIAFGIGFHLTARWLSPH